LVSAHKLFDEMPQKNLVSWSCLISGYTQNEMSDEACSLFKGIISIWNSLIGTLANYEASLLQAVKYFLEMMQGGWRLNN
jgi:pentatricopeptide repeat protein